MSVCPLPASPGLWTGPQKPRHRCGHRITGARQAGSLATNVRCCIVNASVYSRCCRVGAAPPARLRHAAVVTPIYASAWLPTWERWVDSLPPTKEIWDPQSALGRPCLRLHMRPLPSLSLPGYFHTQKVTECSRLLSSAAPELRARPHSFRPHPLAGSCPAL